MNYICQECSVAFLINPSDEGRENKGKYCSRSCSGKAGNKKKGKKTKCIRGNIATRNKHGHCQCDDCKIAKILICSKNSNERVRKWYKNNKEKAISQNKIFRLLRKNRVPKWADFDKINYVYKEAAQMTIKTGIRHHVDHIIPLNGKIVSGLHVHNNLQIIPAIDNLKKSNKFLEVA